MKIRAIDCIEIYVGRKVVKVVVIREENKKWANLDQRTGIFYYKPCSTLFTFKL